MLPGMTIVNTCDYNQTKAPPSPLQIVKEPFITFWTPVLAVFTGLPAAKKVLVGIVCRLKCIAAIL